MAIEFTLYSIDATGNPPDPSTATTKIILPLPTSQKQPSADSIFQMPEGRGTVIETYGGVIVQDFGIPSDLAGGRIFLEDGPILTSTVKSALDLAYAAVDTSWNFTDGINYYKVKFSRNPSGFHAWLNYILHNAGLTRYSYKMELIIEQKVA